MIKTFNYFCQAVIIYFLYILGFSLGKNFSKKIFSSVFSIVGPHFKSRKIIDRNLSIFNNNLSKQEKERIISNMWKNYGKTFIEYIHLGFYKKNNSHIIIEGEEILRNIIDKNKRVIFISGHFANFELMSMEISKKNIKLATIYRPLNNFFLNPLMEFLRRKYVCKNQIRKGFSGVRESIEYINKGYSIALMIDQRVSEGEKINFFGKPAFTTTLPAQLSLKFGLPIIPVFIERFNSEQFKIKFFDEIRITDFSNKIEMSIKLNQVLEKMIEKNPNEWIWTHNRWK